MSPLPSAPTGASIALLALLFGTYLFGLFHIALLPLFEGFDEPAHYAYLQQLALTGTWPRHGDPMSAEVDDNLKVLPAATSLRPSLSYRDFFDGSADALETGRQAMHGAPASLLSWQPGTIANWEAQHPPLYYLMLAPAYRFAEGWSLGARVLLLRALSYTLAWGGLCLGCRAAVARFNREPHPAMSQMLAPALWPLLLPMWYPEMARLGNDSLVSLISGLLVLALDRLFRRGGGRGNHLLVGLGLGLGLLTKATFLPLAAATLILLAGRIGISRPRDLRQGFLNLSICVGAMLAIAGWWYALQAWQTGTLIGSNDAIALSHGPGFWDALHQPGALLSFLRLFALSYGLSLIWTGTWSFVAPPMVFMLPLLGATALLAGAALLGATRPRHGAGMTRRWPDLLAPLTLILITLGLIYQSMILFAISGNAAPAWYLHAFIPVLAPMLGWGIAEALRWPVLRWILTAQMIYAPLFLLIATGVDLLLYSGCAANPQGTHYLDFGSAAACLKDPALMVHNLGVIAFPQFGLGLFVPGFGLLVIGLAAALRILRRG